MKIDQYLRQNGVGFEHHTHSEAYTAQELAAEEHVSGHNVAKAVVVNADGRYVLCALPAPRKLDLQKVSELVGARECRLAEEREMAKIFPDVEIGAEPPFGHLYNLPTLVDEHLAEDDWIVFSAGSHRDAISMRYEDYERLEHPQVADLSLAIGR